MPVKTDSSKCTGCAKCVQICPTNAIRIENEKAVITQECIDCYACTSECETQALLTE